MKKIVTLLLAIGIFGAVSATAFDNTEFNFDKSKGSKKSKFMPYNIDMEKSKKKC